MVEIVGHKDEIESGMNGDIRRPLELPVTFASRSPPQQWSTIRMEFLDSVKTSFGHEDTMRYIVHRQRQPPRKSIESYRSDMRFPIALNAGRHRDRPLTTHC